MSNISKFVHVLNTYLEVESFSPLVYRVPDDALNICKSCCLDKAVLSYIEDGYLLRNMVSSKIFSIAFMFSPKKNKTILIASCFGYILDRIMKIGTSRTWSEHAFSIVVEFLTSMAFKCMFAPYTHFTVDANIPNELFTIRCAYKGVNNFVTLRKVYNHLYLELA